MRLSCIDLHLHLLPGVDDGPRSMEQALEYAAALVRAGVREVTVTPHVGHPEVSLDVRELPRRTTELQWALDAGAIALRVHVGGELHPWGALELGPDELEIVAQGPAPCRWLLLEVPFVGVNAQFLTAAEGLCERGYGLLIAHPERAAGILSCGLPKLAPLLQRGAVLQVNVGSLRGDHGPDAQLAAEHILRTRRACLLASDAHPPQRDITLAIGDELAIAAGLSARRAAQLTRTNPSLMLTRGLKMRAARRLAA